VIDPALSFDPTVHPPPAPPQLVPPFPPPPSSTVYSQHPYEAHVRDDDGRRVFSTASVIDHGSPPDSPGSTPALPDLPEEFEPVVAQGLPAIGISKEEWLRLGGFEPESPAEARPAPTPRRRLVEPQYASVVDDEHDDVFSTPPRQHPHSAQPYHHAPPYPPHGPPYARPPPPASAPPVATYTLPPIHAVGSTHPHDPFAAAPPHPLPPTPSVFASPKSEPADSSWLSPRPPTRSSIRNAPSPVDPTRLRPEPYPTSSAAASSATSPRNLTPVSTALALYACHPIPSAPPEQMTDATFKKKKHGRKFSDNHVPRPRNAFILFRSHAVSTDLIPKSMGITVRPPFSSSLAPHTRSSV